MKNLAQYIEELIIKHECVIVPNLGGFLTYRDKAFVRNNIFYAPTEHIRFNPLLTYHDGLLTEAYMRDRNISYTEALNAIQADVEQIKKSLNNGNTFLLGRIGALSLSADNNIILHNSDSKFLPENIGLPIVHLKQLSSTSNNTGNTIILNVPRISSNALRYVAMLAVVFILSLLIPTHVTDTTHEASFYKQITDYKLQITDSISNQATNTITPINPIASINSIATIDTITTIKTTQNNSQPSTLSSKYHLIIASLTTQAEAEDYIANHKHFDQTQLQIIESKGKFRISAAGFNKYKEALNYMDSIRTNVASAPKAWILCQ
ncbi:MAG: hypothetical protein IJY67_00905 [Paludibacteraceae bacterium]|nr:hypothetical protein [Paludibacteraceae bacterium]